jgi:hypothetical protein
VRKLNERIYLNVAFEDKDDCKSMGGKWDPKKKLWYTEINPNVAQFYRWLPTGLDFDATKLTEKILQISPTWQKIIKKIENMDLYPIDVKLIAYNAAEFCDFGACVSIATGGDNNKNAVSAITQFQSKFAKDENDAIEWLHSRMLLIIKKRYQKI